MLRQHVEQLRQEYTDRYVVVEGDRPELARFRGMTGQVQTINMNGRALVHFEADNNQSRYDLELDFLKVVERPEPKAATNGPANTAPKPEAARQPKPSPLELARKDKEHKPEKPRPDPSATDEGTAKAKPKRPKKPQPPSEVEDPDKLSALERARLQKETDADEAPATPASDPHSP